MLSSLLFLGSSLDFAVVSEQVSDIVADNVKQYTAPQLATIAGAYMQLDHKGYGYTLLLDAIVCQVLRSFKVQHQDFQDFAAFSF